MKVNIYLNFPGTCAEAITYYEKHLGAKLLMKMTFSQMPGDPKNIPPGMENGVLHAQFTLGDTVLMASDGPQALPMRSAYISLNVDNNVEAERIYAALTDDGEVFMAMNETFFAYRFGQLRDKFDVSWMVIHEKPMPQGCRRISQRLLSSCFRRVPSGSPDKTSMLTVASASKSLGRSKENQAR